MENFCQLAMHSRYSFLHGTMDVETICRKAAHDGQRHAALADVNSLAGAVEFVQTCARHGLRPVVGVDLRVPEDGAPPRRVLLLARDAAGYAALCKIVSHLHLSGILPKTNRADDEEDGAPDLAIRHPLQQRPFVLEACLRDLPEEVFILAPDPDLLERLAPHAAASLYGLVFALDGSAAHRRLLDRAEALRLPVVAAHDVFFLHPNDYAVYQTLRAIDLCATVEMLPEEDAGRPEWHWTSRDWMLERFTSPAPVYAVGRLLEQIDLRLDLDTNKPVCLLPGTGQNPALHPSPKHLADLAWAAFRTRYPNPAQHTAIEAGRRVEKELAIIEKLGFADYFLVAHDVVRYAQRQGYAYLGRGSGANSFVAFLLGITQVNPLVLDLYFERFLNPERTSPPDFDLDFSWRDRDDVLAYLYRRHGAAHVAMLSTHVTLRGRGALRQIGRTLGLTDAQLSRYTRRLPRRLFDTLNALLDYYPEAHALDFDDPVLRRLLHAARLLYGLPTHYGVHAGGVLLSATPLTAFTALTRTAKGLPVTQLDMHSAEAWGLMKLDILSTRGLGTFAETLDLVREQDPQIDAKIGDARVILRDTGVRRLLREADTVGVFYVESPGMRSLLTRLRVETFAELTAASSIIRPGVSESGMMQAFVARHRRARGLPAGRTPKSVTHPADTDADLAALLEESHGVMIYQEDVLKVAHSWAGLSLAEADLLRRAMTGASRSSARMQALGKQFIQQCRARGRDETAAREVWRQIRSFAGYSFCKSHSASYARLSMQQAYLKVHHPAEFMVSVLRNGGGYYSPQVYVFEARRQGVPVLLPCVFQSERDDGLVEEGGRAAIRLGLRRIATLDESTIRRIVTARQAGAFTSLEDFLARTGCTRDAAETLIDAGAFDALDGPAAALGAGRRRRAWELHLLAGRHRAWKAGTPPLFPQASTEEILDDLPPLPPYTPAEILYAEMTHLGMPLTHHPITFAWEQAAAEGGAYVRSDAMARYVGRRVEMLGWLMTAKRITTRGGKRPMGFLTLYDGGPDLYEATLFPRAYARCARYLSGGGPYRLEGRIVREYDALTLLADRLAPFEKRRNGEPERRSTHK